MEMNFNNPGVFVKSNHGATLVGLIIGISIIGILAGVFGHDFSQWMERYRVEKQMRDIYVDFVNTRVRAMQSDRIHFVTLTETQYTVREDIYPWPDGDGLLSEEDNVRPSGYSAPIPLVGKDLNPGESITWIGLSGARPQIKFTGRGLVTSGGNAEFAVCMNTNVDADYNCVKISGLKIELKKIKVAAGGSIHASVYDLQ
jgi:Tfp pilus assembly protein FimT